MTRDLFEKLPKIIFRANAYLAAPVVDFLNGAVVIVNKAMLTKIVPENELGKKSGSSAWSRTRDPFTRKAIFCRATHG
jgi:hypothetical protein